MGVPDLPLTSWIGNAGAQTALEVQLVTPEITSTLLVGATGTGKSTLARSFVHAAGKERIILASHATAETIFGCIDTDCSIREGRVIARPGLLAEACGKILILDDIQLFDPALLSDILTAAETGVVHVQRDGLSLSYQVRLQIIATLNPGEGGVSPHILDRFDLCGYCLSLDLADDRALMMQAVLTHEHQAKAGAVPGSDLLRSEELRHMIRMAQDRYPFASIPDGLLDLITRLSDELGVQGHRGEVSLARAALAYASLQGRDQVVLDDIMIIAPLALRHRRSDPPSPPSSPPPRPPPVCAPPPPPRDEETNEERSDEQDGDTGSGGLYSPPDVPTPDSSPEAVPDHGSDPSSCSETAPDQVFAVEMITREILALPAPHKALKPTGALSGRRGGMRMRHGRGRCIRTTLPTEKSRDIALGATIRAAAPYQRYRSKGPHAIIVESPDIRVKVRERQGGRTILFVVDSSGSMGAAQRMSAVKGAIFSLLEEAYLNRDQISLICFRGTQAEVVLPPTRSGARALRLLQDLPTGGRTPLARAVICTMTLLRHVLARGTTARPLVLFLSDGRANVPVTSGNPVEDALSHASGAHTLAADFLVVDTEVGFPRLGLARVFAKALGADYVKLSSVEADTLTSLTRPGMHVNSFVGERKS